MKGIFNDVCRRDGISSYEQRFRGRYLGAPLQNPPRHAASEKISVDNQPLAAERASTLHTNKAALALTCFQLQERKLPLFLLFNKGTTEGILYDGLDSFHDNEAPVVFAARSRLSIPRVILTFEGAQLRPFPSFFRRLFATCSMIRCASCVYFLGPQL